MTIANSAFLIAGIYLSCYLVYWFVLILIHLALGRVPVREGPLTTRFAIVIPAHNEELLLPRLLESIAIQNYPHDRFGTFVVADNCTDGTASVAERDGVVVLTRVDDSRRGKGYAIKLALEEIDLADYEAVVVIDADCVIDSGALRSLDGTMQHKEIVQCYSGIANPDESWFTRLLDVSRTLSNDIYNPSKQHLKLSSQLLGTGMCVGTRILRQYGWDSFSIGEDCEYYAKLIRSGEVVGFDWQAKIFHEESSTLKQATSQRMRWSSGRMAVVWRYGFPLLFAGLVERNAVKFDAGLTLLLPNPSLGMNISLVCLCGALAASGGRVSPLVVWFLILASAQLSIFTLGVLRTQNRFQSFLAIFIAPVFLVWKFGIDLLSILGLGSKGWVRTERKR